MSVTIKQRGDTAANWTAANPVLALREMGLELDTQRFKVGDGVTAWNSLGYWGDSVFTDAIAASSSGGGIAVAADLFLANGKDVYPEGDGAGLFYRNVNNYVPYTDHLNSLPSLTWASYTGFTTPAAVSATASFMSVYHTAASRHFGYLGSYTGSMSARLAPARLSVIGTGIRIDDGSQNNYIQLYAEQQASGLVIYKYRQANGGVEGAAISLYSGQAFLPQFVNLAISVSGNAAFLFLGTDTVLTNLVGVVVFTSWTPTRQGFYHEQSAAGSDVQSASWFDAYL